MWQADLINAKVNNLVFTYNNGSICVALSDSETKSVNYGDEQDYGDDCGNEKVIFYNSELLTILKWE